jgi:hypothetical protein
MGERTSKQDETKDQGKSAKAAEKDRIDGDRKSAETGEKNRMDRDRKSAETGDRDLIDRGRKSAETSDRDRLDRDRKSAETGDRDRIDRDPKSAETGDRDRLDRDRKSAETGDRNADREHAGKSVKIDTDQKEKVRTYFSEHRPTANRVEKSRITVSIGASLPSGIVLVPLPSDIVVVAADCPLQYFVWGDDIVLVDSCSRHVVDIIPNIG